MSQQKNISSLSVEDLLALLNCPQDEIAGEVRNILKDQFSSVTDRWLISGLLEYFFSTNSKRILDLLFAAPEPHSKFLLERISSGMRSSGDRFRYISLLLYAVSRNPPPIWIYRIPNTVMKDLLDILSSSREGDINVLVCGVMVLVLILPSMPFELTKYLNKIFECFLRLVHWTPTREQDIALKPYLQVGVYSLFHRLYALYPCNLLGFMRMNMMGQARKTWFVSTLRPMLERVRLHPLLVTETKETELLKSRWVGLEPCDLIHECAKLCLDPLQEICEEVYLSKSKRRSISEVVPETSEYIILCSSENNFWSPGAVQSPSTINTSVPNTPVYPFKMMGNQSTGIAESPPEAAVEATPETTPFTSPSPLELHHLQESTKLTQRLPKLMTSVSDPCHETRPPSSPLSPIRKEALPFKFPSKHCHDILIKSEKSGLLQNKLQEIQRQRIEKHREEEGSQQNTNPVKSSETMSLDSQEEPLNMRESNKKLSEECNNQAPNDVVIKRDTPRKRKVAVFTTQNFLKEDSENHCGLDLFLEKEPDEENENTDADMATSMGDNSQDLLLTRKDSEDSEHGNDEGLGLPFRQTMTELMKNVKTNRLRFLSQCGPPPNIALLNELGTKKKVALSKSKLSKGMTSGTKQKSSSFPNLFKDDLNIPSTLPKRDYTTSSLSLSPVKPPVEMFEVATQTEEAPIIDPYEQLLEALMLPIHWRSNDTKENLERDGLSPFQNLDDFIKYCCQDDVTACQETAWNASWSNFNDKSRNHLRAMQCVLMLERYQRESHAERNRRLLGRIKKLHLLQEKEVGLYKEKVAMKEEMVVVQQTLLKLQEKNMMLEKKLNDMVDKKTMVEAQEKEIKATYQRDHLKMACESLQKEKLLLIRDLENCRGDIRESQRQLKVHLRHSAENVVLRGQVEDLNKRILIMGEIQLEMQQQMRKYREKECEAKTCALARENDVLSRKVEELEQRNKAEKLSLEAALSRIGELEMKLGSQHSERVKQQLGVETTVASWKERCEALEKRNKDLCSINITLESQITQLLRFRPEREREEGADARLLVAPMHRDAFPLSAARSYERNLFPEAASDSFMARMTSCEFKPLGHPKPDEL